MKWRLICAVFGAVVGYCVSRSQNAAVHGELAVEIHRNRVLADRAERAEKRLKWVGAQLDAVLLVPQVQCSDGALRRPTVAVIRDGGQA